MVEYENNSINLINLAKLIASILVVAIHTMNPNADMGYFVIVVSRVAVPFFFICSGYFLSSKLYYQDKSIRKKYIYKYIQRIFNYYLIWSAIYFCLRYKGYFKMKNLLETIVMIIRDFLFIGISEHLWYLSAICVSTYILYLLTNKLKFKYIIIISSLLYLFCLLGDSYYGIIKGTILEAYFNIYIYYFGEVWNSFSQGLIFIVIGVAIKKYDLINIINVSLKKVIIFYVLFLFESYTLKSFNIAKDNNTSISLIILSFYIFIIIMKCENEGKNDILKKYSNIIKNISFNIYLIHPLVYIVISKIFNVMKINVLNNMYIKFLFVLIGSLSFSWIIEWLRKVIQHKNILDYNRIVSILGEVDCEK